MKTLKRCCELLEKRLYTILRDDEQFNRYIVNEKEGSSTYCREEIFKKADDKALKNTVSILKEVAEVKRSILAAQKPDSSADNGTGVILIARAECEDSE